MSYEKEIDENSILFKLREEQEMKLKGGLYHQTQIRMAYNSNHMEGSRLTEDQTRSIYETRTIGVNDGYEKLMISSKQSIILGALIIFCL